jgi:hypothetical protein
LSGTRTLRPFPGPEGAAPVFEAAPKPTQGDIEDVVRRAQRRILRYLEKRGVITFAVRDESLGESNPVLARLFSAATVGVASTQNPWVVRWDGCKLSAIGNGLPGPVSRLVKYKGKLYAQAQGQDGDQTKNGLFEMAGPWSRVEFPGLRIQYVTSAVEFGGELYLDGSFETDSQEMLSFIRWNGQRWEAVRGLAGVTALAADGTNLYASGRDPVSNAGFDGIAAWNGSVWTPLANLPSQNILSLHAHEGFLYAGLKYGEAFGDEVSFKLARWSISPLSGIQASRDTPRQSKPGLRISLEGLGFGEFLDLQGRRKAGLPGKKQAAGIGVYYLAR